jgi:cellulose synthase/poly-beta-1,6-N-acetylglucosamine synthase-like glycosyltransferase
MFIEALNKKNIERIKRLRARILKVPTFLYEESDVFLKRYVLSEWNEYELWLLRNRLFSIQGLRNLYKKVKKFRKKPRISIIMPVYNPDPWEFKQAVDSILWQVYPHWELCIVDDFSDNREYLKLLGKLRDRRIRVHISDRRRGIAETSQYALQIAAGDFVATMDQDDELYPDALFSFVNLLQDNEIDYFYSDRDMISPQGKRYMHFFKPGWSPEYLLSFNYVTHLEIFNKKLIQDVGGFRKEYEGS